MSWIVNVSGSLAAPWMGGRNGPSSTKPRAGAVCYGKALSPTRRHHTHPQGDGPPHAAPVVNYRVAGLRAGLLEQVLFTLRSPTMPQTPILVPARLRRPPKTGWSWVDRLFMREHAARLSRDAVLLYFFLCAVADKHGQSFYGDGTVATLLRMTLPAMIQAREELLARDLIAHETRLTQVLSLLPAQQLRRTEPGQGLMQLGEILRRVAALPDSTTERSLP
jgi:hypothetical protein